MERIAFQTADNVTIVADWTLVSNVALSLSRGQVALLLHMMPADRTSWRPLSLKLFAAGIASLAIDLRGHGESTKKLSFATKSLASSKEHALNYTTFTDAEQQASRLDVDAALAWLKFKGYDSSRVVMIGASIGANLAIDASARYTEIPKVVMLSGGLDYHGVTTELSARQLSVISRVLLVASADDDYSLQSHRALTTILGPRATFKELTNAGHGTTMFSNEPKLLDDIVTFAHKISPLSN